MGERTIFVFIQSGIGCTNPDGFPGAGNGEHIVARQAFCHSFGGPHTILENGGATPSRSDPHGPGSVLVNRADVVCRKSLQCRPHREFGYSQSVEAIDRTCPDASF